MCSKKFIEKKIKFLKKRKLDYKNHGKFILLTFGTKHFFFIANRVS